MEVIMASIDEARAARNAALTETDKYVLSDYPITKFGLWRIKNYRQHLRDWPENEGFPDLSTMPQAEDWSQYKLEKNEEGNVR